MVGGPGNVGGSLPFALLSARKRYFESSGRELRMPAVRLARTQKGPWRAPWADMGNETHYGGPRRSLDCRLRLVLSMIDWNLPWAVIGLESTKEFRNLRTKGRL